MPTLNWIGKETVVNHHQQVPFHLLQDVPELSCGNPGSGNLIVEGDNLLALKALLPYYAGQVKCIYIDPPYNTGNEGWTYNDNVNSTTIRQWLGQVVGKEGETLDRHDRWLCMMTATVHDSGYKRLFSNKTIFRQLIETFVEEEWVSRLDFDRAERLDKSFVTEHYKESEADIIYKVPLHNSDKVIYLCLLIEFQSDVQRFMVLRSLHYKCSFYMDYVLSNKNTRQLLLPAMFQLVLYNGDEKWTAPDNIDQLIEKEVNLGAYGLHFEHLVIAENTYDREWLEKVNNIIATLFIAEAHYDLPLLMEKLLNLYDTETDQQAVQIFVNWFRQLAAHGKIESTDFAQIEDQYLTREEVKSMLIKALEREREAIRQQEREAIRKEEREAMRNELESMLAQTFAREREAMRNELESMLAQTFARERDSIRQESIDMGKQEGIAQRNRQVILAMVANGFSAAMIAQLLELPLADVEKLLVEADQDKNERKE